MNDLLEHTEEFVASMSAKNLQPAFADALCLLREWAAQEHQRRKQAARDAEKGESDER